MDINLPVFGIFVKNHNTKLELMKVDNDNSNMDINTV